MYISIKFLKNRIESDHYYCRQYWIIYLPFRNLLAMQTVPVTNWLCNSIAFHTFTIFWIKGNIFTVVRVMRKKSWFDCEEEFWISNRISRLLPQFSTNLSIYLYTHIYICLFWCVMLPLKDKLCFFLTRPVCIRFCNVLFK